MESDDDLSLEADLSLHDLSVDDDAAVAEDTALDADPAEYDLPAQEDAVFGSDGYGDDTYGDDAVADDAKPAVLQPMIAESDLADTVPIDLTEAVRPSRAAVEGMDARPWQGRSGSRSDESAEISTAEISTAAQGSEPSGTPAEFSGVTTANSLASAGSEVEPGEAKFIGRIFGGLAQFIRQTFFNQVPTVNPMQLTGHTDGLITGNINAVDPEGDPLTYSLTESPEYGMVLISSDGSFTYTPASSFPGQDAFTVTVTDGGFHINLFRPNGTVATVGVTQTVSEPEPGPGPGPAPGPSSELSFDFIYGSGSQHWSDAARDALESAATTVASYIDVASPVTLTYSVRGTNNGFSSVLGSASSGLAGFGSGFHPTVVQEKILTGVDPNGSSADAQISFNFGQSWSYDDSVGFREFDFHSVVMHELMHTFGFLSLVGRSGTNSGRTWSAMDEFIVTSDNVSAIGSDLRWNNAFNQNLTGRNGGLYFGGASAVDAYGGLVPLYTPNPWQSGSSVSHLDGSTFTGANRQLMNPSTRSGLGVRTLSPIELGMLEDMGYSVVSPMQTQTLLFITVIFLRRRKMSEQPAALRRV